MNCEALHSRLLGSEKPDRLTADLAAHLKSCAACRKWQRRLLHLERNVALLPVAPAPRGKLEFVRQFVAAELEPLPESAKSRRNRQTVRRPFRRGNSRSSRRRCDPR